MAPLADSGTVKHMQNALQLKLQANGLTKEQECELVQDFESAVPCSTQSLTDLKEKVLPALYVINGEVRTQARDRDRRFFVHGLYEGSGVREEEDGNVCIEDDVAVMYEVEGS